VKRRRGRHRHAAELQTRAAQQAGARSEEHALSLASIAQPVALKSKKSQSGDDEEGGSRADDKPKNAPNDKPSAEDGASKTAPGATAKTENAGKDTAQAKAAEDALKLSREIKASPAALLAKLKSLRRKDEDNLLWSILRSVNPDTADLADPERWWEFRRGEVRRALNDGHPGTAYAIARAHGPLDEESQSEAEFLAGWIALRFLKNPAQAQVHFMAARLAKDIVRDEARSAYWLGRAKLELGDKATAENLFKEASSRFYTYYGALARQALKGYAQCEFRPPVQPTKDEIAAFINDDAIKAVMIIKQLDLQPVLINYLLDLARQIKEPYQITLLLELTERVAPPNVAVRVAKIALLRGFAADAYAFPARLPKYDPAGGNGKVELALLSALTRQESEFHTGTVSSAGARGLMQLLPQTARLVASANKIKYETSKLISDPSYNVTLGSAFLASLLSAYDGSYVMALAGYNAGPGRVSQWIKEFGDPRAKSMDPVDWIERIPFTETRNYVQRILEGTQLYRCRFENSKVRFQIVQDLHRGRPGKVPDLGEFSGSAEPDQGP
jgi:soluble lytic murein transglycosylase